VASESGLAAQGLGQEQVRGQKKRLSGRNRRRGKFAAITITIAGSGAFASKKRIHEEKILAAGRNRASLLYTDK